MPSVPIPTGGNGKNALVSPSIKAGTSVKAEVNIMKIFETIALAVDQWSRSFISETHGVNLYDH
jgi:hypothetical protein